VCLGEVEEVLDVLRAGGCPGVRRSLI
jgi:hypothetical protein